MRRLVIVIAACLGMIGATLAAKYAIALIIGIVVGTTYFFLAMSKGYGIAQVRMTRDPSEPVKPRDPNGSIGMAVAASGIAASAMFDDNYPQPARVFYGACFVLGMVIALFVAAKAAKTPPAAGTADPLDNRRDTDINI